jgi:hypothetical protein
MNFIRCTHDKLQGELVIQEVIYDEVGCKEIKELERCPILPYLVINRILGRDQGIEQENRIMMDCLSEYRIKHGIISKIIAETLPSKT